MQRRVITTTGHNGAGIISDAEFKVGDEITVMQDDGQTLNSGFAGFIVTDGELIQFSSVNFSAITLHILIK